MKRSELSCAELARLYLDVSLSAPEIAKRLGCSVGMVYTRLEECGISTRSMSDAAILNRGVKITDDLRRLYIEEELSIYDIAQKFNCSPVTIHRLLKRYKIEARPAGGAVIEYPKNDFDGNLTDKAYLVGFRHGDLHVEKGNWAIRVRCTSTKDEQLELIQNLFQGYGGVWISKTRIRRGKCITAHLNLSFDFLLPRDDQIANWILGDDKLFSAFWAGYLDAEGSFIISGRRAYFKVDSCDKGILHDAWQKLTAMGLEISPPYIVRKRGTISGLIISQCDLWRLTTERKETLLELCRIVEPYLRHAKRRTDLKRVQENLEKRIAR